MKTAKCDEGDDEGDISPHFEASPHSAVVSLTSTLFSSGFRLFLSSVPGQAADPPPAPPRRRPVPSSRFFFLCVFLCVTNPISFRSFHATLISLSAISDSDSEMETRLKEAAVSISDLVPSAERPCSENSKREEEAESHVLKKKKKKKKRRGDEGDASGSPLPAQSNGEREPVRGRKKKKRETNKDAVN